MLFTKHLVKYLAPHYIPYNYYILIAVTIILLVSSKYRHSSSDMKAPLIHHELDILGCDFPPHFHYDETN